MILLVSNAAKRGYPHTGDFLNPRQWNLTPTTPIWAADNDAFNGFNADAFKRMLDRIAVAPVPPKFVTVPDVVCNYVATGDLWVEWAREFRSRGIPQAYVLQNGIEEHPPEYAIPWSQIDAIFIGGDDRFKLGPYVRRFVWFAKHYARRWVHMGRVNSIRRMSYARAIGCDSCDGSGMARFPRTVLAPMAYHLQNEARQIQLELH